MSKKMTGYKGFTKDWKCQKFQFKVGETFAHEGAVELCKSGFHFCENPLDVLKYYQPATSEYAQVEADAVDAQTDSDSKRVCAKIKISATIKLAAIISAGVSFLIAKAGGKKKIKSGDSSHAATSGNYSPVETKGKNSIAAAIGKKSTAKSEIGNRIVLSEISDEGEVLCVATIKVDGKKIKSNTFYKLTGGNFIEA